MRFILNSLGIILFSTMAAANPSLPPHIDIKIYDADSGRHKYTGVETINVSNNVVTKTSSYDTLDGKRLQDETSVYDMRSLKVSAFRFINHVSGEARTMEMEDDNYLLKHISQAGEAEESETLKITPTTYLGKVLHHVIIDRWQKILAGETYTFELIVPSRMETIAFQILLHQQNEDQAVIRMQPDFWFIRKLVDPLDFYYEKTTQRLVRYTGPSFLAHEQDEVIRADFLYPVSK